jgi:hypothetical protein
MKFEEFTSSLSADSPPPGISVPLEALWHDAKGNWEKAHRTAQDGSSKEAAWVHAYLHRKEGDSSNARYWYAHARKKPVSGSLEEEWKKIVIELLDA